MIQVDEVNCLEQSPVRASSGALKSPRSRSILCRVGASWLSTEELSRASKITNDCDLVEGDHPSGHLSQSKITKRLQLLRFDIVLPRLNCRLSGVQAHSQSVQILRFCPYEVKVSCKANLKVSSTF